MQLHALLIFMDSIRLVGDIQPIPTVLSNTQDAHMDSIPGSAEIAGNPTDLVDTAITRLDTFNNRYRQTLSTFITVINGISRVCHPNRRRSNLTDHCA